MDDQIKDVVTPEDFGVPGECAAEAMNYAKHMAAKVATDALDRAERKIQRLSGQMETLQASRNFYALRCEALQAIQSKMRNPERKAVCDILANGSTEVFKAVDRSHQYAQSKEHGGCAHCGYPEHEPWHRRDEGR